MRSDCDRAHGDDDHAQTVAELWAGSVNPLLLGTPQLNARPTATVERVSVRSPEALQLGRAFAHTCLGSERPGLCCIAYGKRHATGQGPCDTADTKNRPDLCVFMQEHAPDVLNSFFASSAERQPKTASYPTSTRSISRSINLTYISLETWERRPCASGDGAVPLVQGCRFHSSGTRM